jgi:uncharacterized protein
MERNMSRLVHFEITGADSAALAEFYASHLDFRVRPSPFLPNYHLLETVDGISGAVMDRNNQARSTILWFEVDDLDESVRRIAAAGGAVAGEKNTIPGQGHVQYVADPAGNIIGLKQPIKATDGD